jgi:hypothetical protein
MSREIKNIIFFQEPENRGMLIFTLYWVSIGGRLQKRDFDTQVELENQIIHLLNLGYKSNNLNVVRNISFEVQYEGN